MSDTVTRLRCAVLGGEMDGRDIAEAADEIERLRIERDTISKPLHAEIERLRAEVARLTAALREAFRAGFWAAVGPANEAEFQELSADEQGAWDARAALNGEKE